MEFVQEIYRKFNQAKYWAPEVDECPTGQLLAVGLSFTLYETLDPYERERLREFYE